MEIVDTGVNLLEKLDQASWNKIRIDHISRLDDSGQLSAHHPAMRSGTYNGEVHPGGRSAHRPWGLQG
jgi:hypothetical protein